MSLKKLTYHLQTLEELAPTVYRARLTPPTNDFLRYRAGQYVEIICRDYSLRPFSIANVPDEKNHQLEFHIRYQPGNAYTTEIIEQLTTNKQLHLQGPLGNCVLQSHPEMPIIFVAGGTGFAPIKALLEELLPKHETQPIYFYWGVRTVSDFYMHDLAQQWQTQYKNFHYVPVLSSTAADWHGRTGLIYEAVLQDHPLLNQHHVYISGPSEMVFASWKKFATHGLERKFIYSDILDFPVDG